MTRLLRRKPPGGAQQEVGQLGKTHCDLCPEHANRPRARTLTSTPLGKPGYDVCRRGDGGRGGCRAVPRNEAVTEQEFSPTRSGLPPNLGHPSLPRWSLAQKGRKLAQDPSAQVNPGDPPPQARPFRPGLRPFPCAECPGPLSPRTSFPPSKAPF